MQTKAIILASLIILTASCGPNYHLKRSQYHKRMAIAKGAEIKSDTVYTDRVVITPGDSTVVTLPGANTVTFRDTVIYQDRIKIRVRRDTLRETIHVECPPDTVRISVPIAVHETIKCGIPWWIWAIIGALGAVIVAFFVAINLRQSDHKILR